VIEMTGDFIQPAEVTEITGLSIAALAQLRHRGQGPRFYKPTPRTVLYKREEVIAWLEASAQTATTTYA
jgi:predicted DNA-binding transcriptional regulator AlpA